MSLLLLADALPADCRLLVHAGAFGAVYKATLDEVDSGAVYKATLDEVDSVAVKMLPSDQLRNDQVQAFLTEV